MEAEKMQPNSSMPKRAKPKMRLPSSTPKKDLSPGPDPSKINKDKRKQNSSKEREEEKEKK
jgi:hypothetical protein